MSGLDDTIRSVAPGGIGKPLLLALGALLASGALFRGGGAGRPLVQARNRHQTRVLVDCSADWAGC